MSDTHAPLLKKLLCAAVCADWKQVVLNGGPPCFHLSEAGRFCLRAERWMGHGTDKQRHDHAFVSLADLLAALAPPSVASPITSEQKDDDDLSRHFLGRAPVRLDHADTSCLQRGRKARGHFFKLGRGLIDLAIAGLRNRAARDKEKCAQREEVTQ